MRVERPKIVGLKELREQREYDPWSVANKVTTQRSWFWRLLNWISGRADLAKTVIRLREQIINMETVRLAGLRETDQAGLLGLKLYAENQYLRSQIDRLDPEEYEASRDFYRKSWEGAAEAAENWRRKHELLSAAHERFLRDYEAFCEKFLEGKPNG